jgi:hypothetical protein
MLRLMNRFLDLWEIICQAKVNFPKHLKLFHLSLRMTDDRFSDFAQAGQPIHSLSICTRYKMPVYVYGDFDAGMSELFLYIGQ